tara:strand:- start:35 stop:649 length:615 start_codon:yes stop_codon:yes gene_type:complete
MIVSEKHKFAYIAIPKTGTTSVHRAFSNLNDDTLFIEDKNHDHEGRVNKFMYKHINIKKLKPQIENFDKYYKFTFVRNPYARFVSWVYYYHGLHGLYKHDKSNLDKYSFKELIPECPKYVWHSQLEYVLSEDGKNLMNFVGKLENFQEDLNTICDKIAIPRQELPHKNKSKHKHYTEYYDDETRSMVAEKFAEDIEYFGYEFGD